MTFYESLTAGAKTVFDHAVERAKREGKSEWDCVYYFPRFADEKEILETRALACEDCPFNQENCDEEIFIARTADEWMKKGQEEIR